PATAVPTASPAAIARAASAASAPLTTLRSALLSWELTTSEELGAPQLVPGSFASSRSITAATAATDVASMVAGAPSSAASWTPSSPSSSSSPSSPWSPSSIDAYRDLAGRLGTTARTMVEAMTLPMLGEAGAVERPASWASPGMIANSAQAWAVAQERSSTDLALDFVAPELVLAARVYGLGPAAAAQAARLAIAGPSQLGAMASTVDRTFIEAMAIGREARLLESERQQRLAAAAAAVAADGAPSGAPAPGMAAPGMAAPGMAAPGMAASGMAASGMAAPGMAAPGMAASGMAVPGMAAPGMAAPGMAAPGTAAPSTAAQLAAAHDRTAESAAARRMS